MALEVSIATRVPGTSFAPDPCMTTSLLLLIPTHPKNVLNQSTTRVVSKSVSSVTVMKAASWVDLSKDVSSINVA